MDLLAVRAAVRPVTETRESPRLGGSAAGALVGLRWALTAPGTPYPGHNLGVGMIVRSPRRRHFTVLPNDTLEDASLSFKAKGLLAYVLSKPDEWRCNSRQLASVGPDGLFAVRKALEELSKAGYAELVKQRNADGTTTSEWHITEEPTRARFPNPGETNTGEPRPLVSTEEQGLKNNPPTPQRGEQAKDDYPPDFLACWDIYPRKLEKKNALKAYRARLRAGASPDQLLHATKHYAEHVTATGTELRFVKHPATFYGPGDPWRDYLDGPPGGSAEADEGYQFTEEAFGYRVVE